LCAIKGRKTLSSSWPRIAPIVIAVSLPITCAATCVTDSHSTGLTLPGMIEDPGWSDGRRSSPSPARGPLASRRTSSAIFASDAAIVLSAPLASSAASRAPWASKWSRASTNSSAVSDETVAITRAANPGGALSPVPTAVPPSASSRRPSLARRARAIPARSCAAQPPNSWPTVIGVASWRWVRPSFTTSANSRALRSSAPASSSSAGTRSRSIASRAATCNALGITSLEDWARFTSSLGWTCIDPRACPSSSLARFAITSFAFMFVDVPEPVWNTSTTKSASRSPRITSRAARSIASAVARGIAPLSRCAAAAAALIRPSASMKRRGIRWPLIGKFSRARCVCAP
jgi:hypothetical protein